jgi:pilus assembly protein Flp/PilA
MRRFIAAEQTRRFLAAREGTTAVEYAVIASGIAGALIATVFTLGGTVAGMWTAVAAIFN